MPLDLGKSKDEFVVSMAALALYDGEAEITGENILQLLAATGNEVAPYWPDMFVNIFKDGNIEKLIFARGGGGGDGGAAAASGGDAVVADAAPEEKKKEKVEEVDALDGGMDMFGGGGADY